MPGGVDSNGVTVEGGDQGSNYCDLVTGGEHRTSSVTCAYPIALYSPKLCSQPLLTRAREL